MGITNAGDVNSLKYHKTEGKVKKLLKQLSKRQKIVTVADLRLLSVDDYYRMVEASVLATDERVELIAGHSVLDYRLISARPQHGTSGSHSPLAQCHDSLAQRLHKVDLPKHLLSNLHPRPSTEG